MQLQQRVYAIYTRMHRVHVQCAPLYAIANARDTPRNFYFHFFYMNFAVLYFNNFMKKKKIIKILTK